jgi:choline dehydrogenase
VLLLEAGSRDRAKEIRIPAAFSKLFKSKFDWGFETAPQEGPRRSPHLHAARQDAGRVLGDQCPGVDSRPPQRLRGLARGLELGGREALVRAHRERARIDLGPTRPEPDVARIRRCRRCGDRHTYVGSQPRAAGGRRAGPVTQRNGLRHTAADAYLKPARRRANLVVQAGARALGVNVEGGRVTGVRYRQAGKDQEIFPSCLSQ